MGKDHKFDGFTGQMAVLEAVLLVLLSNLLAIYQLNLLLLLLLELSYSSERLIYLDYINSSSKLVMRRPRYRHQRAPSRFWIKPGKTQVWWDNFVNNVVPREEWKENFRMTRATFLSLCEEIRPCINRRQSTVVRRPIEVERQVAATLYYLAD